MENQNKECKDHSKCTSPFCTKYPNEDILIDEFVAKAHRGDFEIPFSNTARNSYTEIAYFFINKFNQKLKEIEQEISKAEKPHEFKVVEIKDIEAEAFNNGLNLALQIIKNKKI